MFPAHSFHDAVLLNSGQAHSIVHAAPGPVSKGLLLVTVLVGYE